MFARDFKVTSNESSLHVSSLSTQEDNERVASRSSIDLPSRRW